MLRKDNAPPIRAGPLLRAVAFRAPPSLAPCSVARKRPDNARPRDPHNLPDFSDPPLSPSPALNCRTPPGKVRRRRSGYVPRGADPNTLALPLHWASALAAIRLMGAPRPQTPRRGPWPPGPPTCLRRPDAAHRCSGFARPNCPGASPACHWLPLEATSHNVCLNVKSLLRRAPFGASFKFKHIVQNHLQAREHASHALCSRPGLRKSLSQSARRR